MKDKFGGDGQESSSVGIKKFNRAFEQIGFTRRAYRELKIMRLLDHENILHISNILIP